MSNAEKTVKRADLATVLRNNPVASMTLFVLVLLLVLSLFPWPFQTSVVLSDGTNVVLLSGTESFSVSALHTVDATIWAGSDTGTMMKIVSAGEQSVTPLSYTVSGKVNSIFPTELNFWCGYDGGAFILTGDTGREIPLPVTGKSISVTSFARGGDRMWVGTDVGLYSYDFAAWSVHPPSPAIGNVQVNALVQRNQNLYCGTDKGLFRVSDTWVPVAMADGGTFSVNELLLLSDGTLVCATSAGLLYVDANDAVTRAEGVSFEVLSVAVDGNTLYAGSSQGLYRGSAGSVFRRIEGLPYNRISVLRTDRDYLWLGTDRGLFSYELKPTGEVTAPSSGAPVNVPRGNPDLWTAKARVSELFKVPAGYQNQQFLFVKADQDQGIVWAGSEKGVFRFDRNGRFIEHRRKGNGLPDDKVHVIDFNGTKTWFGTMGGLALLENGQWSSFTRQSGELLDNNVWALYSTDEGLWVGTDGGLQFRSNEGKWKSWTLSDSPLVENWIQTITSNSKGVVYVGIWNGGIAVFPNASRTRTQDIEVILDPDGLGDKDTAFNDGLIGDGVTSVVVDDKDHVWAGTSRGLSRFDSVSWFDYIHKDWSMVDLPLNYLEVGKDDQTILVCGANGMFMVRGSRYRVYRPLPVSGSTGAVEIIDGDAATGPTSSTWLEGSFPSSYIWSVAIIDRFAVIGTAKGLVALEFEGDPL